MWRQILPAFRAVLLLTVLTGLLYPGVVTGLAQVLFHDQANGSLIEQNGHVIGSSLRSHDVDAVKRGIVHFLSDVVGLPAGPMDTTRAGKQN